MRFEARLLNGAAEPVSETLFQEGSVYFAVNYADDEMLIPVMETVVFIGRDLEPGVSGIVYFQDIDSYQRGIRFDGTSGNGPGRCLVGPANRLKHIFNFERALDELLRCSLRRRKQARQAET